MLSHFFSEVSVNIFLNIRRLLVFNQIPFRAQRHHLGNAVFIDPGCQKEYRDLRKLFSARIICSTCTPSQIGIS